MSVYQVVIVGAGPAGLSAAARAAQLDAAAGRRSPSYVLLEGFKTHAKTIHRYQKGKHVMAEPGFLDLRSDLGFIAGAREKVLETWVGDLAKLKVSVRYGAEVTRIAGSRGAFQLELAGGESIAAEHVVLAIGLAGNPHRIGVDGEDCEGVQYQLDDPKEYSEERILVVGAGDSAIENALALAEQNDVWIINRGKEFNRAKEGNLNAVLAAITNPRRRLGCYYETRIKRIGRLDRSGPPLEVVLQTPKGELTVHCHRVIARLGSMPPRKFVESVGVTFPNERPDAIPALSRHYESNVPGLYIIGSLAGFPLIKQAMNQGHDVIEFIHGNFVKPADYPLLEYQFEGLPFAREVDELLERFQALIPMFRELNALAFRELIIESDILVAYPAGAERKDALRKIEALRRKLGAQAGSPRTTRIISAGSVIYAPGEFGTSFFTILAGEVALRDGKQDSTIAKLGRGDFFGEMSLLSGRPRTHTAIAGPGCILVETPRRTMLKLMSSHEEVRSGIDWIFTVRELQRHFAPTATLRELREISGRMNPRQLKAGEVLFREGEKADSLFILRSGNISLSRKRNGEDAFVAQAGAGQLIGEMAFMGDPVRRDTATATVAAELIEVKSPEFLELARRSHVRMDPLHAVASQKLVDSARMQVRPEAGSLMNFLMNEGLGEATNVLVINESLCVGCDNCEKACAETHGGISRLDRKAGNTFAEVHIPISCRHCEQPHCMKDCPPNAIRRSPTGEVFIDASCIGCGNCVVNCPYDAIKMSHEAPSKPGLIPWFTLGWGPGPGEEPSYRPTEKAKARGKKATKCDACLHVDSGPACVTACPTGAAIRISPRQYVDLVEERKR